MEICTMVRDEEEHIEEFVEYHRLIGASHIHVYLHQSADTTAHRLDKFVDQGFVTVRAWDLAPCASSKASVHLRYGSFVDDIERLQTWLFCG